MEMFKILVSAIMGLLGPYYMYRGKKTQNLNMILIGAALIVLSYFLFSGSGDDKTTKDVLKNMIPPQADQQQTLPTPGQQLP